MTAAQTEPVPQFMSAEDEIEALAQMHEAASESIQMDRKDPHKQRYFVRMDKRTLVASDSEAHYCMNNEIQMATVDYNTAISMVNKENAEVKAAKQRRVKRKVAKATRKRNRKR